MASEDQLQITACNSSELRNGDIRELSFGEHGTALVVKCNDKISAIGSKCTHYGAPLAKGSLIDGRLRCPWHGACFNIQTGDIEDYPGLDSLQVFTAEEKDGSVIVKARKDLLKNGRRRQKMSSFTDGNGHGVLIIGGGATAITCAESLRQRGYCKKIVILTKDSHPPYDRTKLSKVMNVAAASTYLREEAFYKEYGITVKCNSEVTKLDTSAKSVRLQDGSSESYDKLLIATGSTPRVLPIPGWGLKNVFVLRNHDDASKIFQGAAGKNVVVIGASFIGMEVASSLVEAAESVTVCEYFSAPYQTVLGSEVGKVFQTMHEERGIVFYMNASVTELKGSEGAVQHVVLNNGTLLKADIVIAGVGVIPATKFLQNSGVELDARGYVHVNKYLETNVKDVYAGGDIAVFPLKMRSWEPVNVQHWQMAHYHGRVVGMNMASAKSTEASSVPFFWSSLGPGKNIRYAGNGLGHDSVVIAGSLAERKFCAYYCKGDEVVAVATYMMDPRASELAENWRNGIRLLKSNIPK